MNATIAKDRDTITVHVPLTFRKRGGRKQVVTPQGAVWAAPRARVDNTMVKAIARGFRWRGGDPQWAAVGGHHARLPLETVPGRMGQAEQVVEAISAADATHHLRAKGCNWLLLVPCRPLLMSYGARLSLNTAMRTSSVRRRQIWPQERRRDVGAGGVKTVQWVCCKSRPPPKQDPGSI